MSAMPVLVTRYVVPSRRVARADIRIPAIRRLANTRIRATAGNQHSEFERYHGMGLVLLKAKMASTDEALLLWRIRRREC